MADIRRDYLPTLVDTHWIEREAWLGSRDDADPESIAAGLPVRLTGAAREAWNSGPVPTPLDHDVVALSFAGRAANARVGIEWCQAKRGKRHTVVWADHADDGTFAIHSARAIRTTASFRVVVEAVADGIVQLEIDECIGTLESKLDVLVNQVGYDVNRPKRFTVQSNAPLEGPATFCVVAPIAGPGQEFVTVLAGELEPAGEVSEWGRWYWRGDITPLDEPGNYYVEVRIGSAKAESPVFSVGDNFVARKTLDTAQRFFFWQRCGQAVPGWHDACHLDDRITTDDGVTIEAAGAWHDAGDYNKYNGFTPLSVYSLLYARERCPDLFQTQRQTGRDDILDEAIWGADYLRKMQDPKTGALWGQHSSGYGYWGIPERETDNRIGGDDDRVASGQTTSRWLVASFAHLGAALASEEYVGRALAHWPLAYNSESDAVSHAAETMFAALELERATGDGMYRTVADDCARKIVACQGSDDRYSGWFAGTPGGGAPAYAVVDDGLPGAALAHWLHNSANHPFAAEALACLERYVGFLRAVSDNQLNIARAYRGNSETWFYQYETDRDWYVGQNSQYLSDAWAAFISHRVTGSSEALAVGLDQLDWVLGRNPYGLCMLHGEGRVNTATAHHRYNTIVGQPQGAVPGSVFNGIVRFNARNDIPLWDLIEQGTPRYQCNEPWLPHNAYYLMAVSELGAIRGGT